MDWEKKKNKKLLQAILFLRTEKEARRFLRDLMTEKEIEEFAKRLEAAEMLSTGISYLRIAEKTGLSSTTIARVGKWLKRKESGYRTIIQRLHHHSPVRPRKGLS